MKAGRFAFPIGAFLVSDGALISVFLLKLIDPQKMLALANNNTELAKSYIFGMMVMIAALTVQVICWLISLLFAAFRYFQKVNFSAAPASAASRAELEAELRAKIEAELRAGLIRQTSGGAENHPAVEVCAHDDPQDNELQSTESASVGTDDLDGPQVPVASEINTDEENVEDA